MPHRFDSPVQQGIFLPVSTFSADSYGVCTPPCATACINICVHVKDPVVSVRVWWIMETLKHPACTVGWVVRLWQPSFLGENNLDFPWKKSHWDSTIQLLWKMGPKSPMALPLLDWFKIYSAKQTQNAKFIGWKHVTGRTPAKKILLCTKFLTPREPNLPEILKLNRANLWWSLFGGLSSPGSVQSSTLILGCSVFKHAEGF